MDTPAPIEDRLARLPQEFSGFIDQYRTQIAPALAAREHEREAAVAHAAKFRAIGILAGALIAGGSLLLLHAPIGAFIGLIAGGGLWAWGERRVSALAKELKSLLVRPIAGEFGMTYEAAPAPPPRIADFRSLGLVGDWDRSSFEDRLTGERHGLPFEFFEAHLERKQTTTDSRGRTRTTWVTVFRGQCLIVDFPKPFEGVTKVFRDAGVFNALAGLGQKWGAKLDRVRLEDPEFERAFEVYGSDQIEARFLLTPDFMQRLVDLEAAFSGKRLRCALAGGEMLTAVEGRNHFEPGSMRRPLDDADRVGAIVDDFVALFRLIDAMQARRLGDPAA